MMHWQFFTTPSVISNGPPLRCNLCFWPCRQQETEFHTQTCCVQENLKPITVNQKTDSKLVYNASVVTLPPNFAKDVDEHCFKFIWNFQLAKV